MKSALLGKRAAVIGASFLFFRIWENERFESSEEWNDFERFEKKNFEFGECKEHSDALD